MARDHAEAARRYGQAAEQGHAEAQYRLGVMLRGDLGVARDVEAAAPWLRKAAEQGVARARSLLGHMYQFGQGVPHDDVAAAQWYRLAAESGCAKCQVRLAKMYYHGRGVKWDRAEALRWYRRAAELGDPEAPFYLGVMYYNGEGVKPDHIQSHKWFDLAAARAEPGRIRDETANNRDIVAFRMSPAEIAEARRLARSWRPGQHAAVAPAAAANPAPKPAHDPADILADKRQRIFRVQRALWVIGYGHDPADGRLGPTTRAAIRAFQSREGLPVTGRTSDRLEAALRSAGPLGRAWRDRRQAR